MHAEHDASRINNPARLAAVRASGLVDTPPEEPFDRLTRVAALVLRAPIAFVTVVDDQRSWYKSCVGLPDDADRSGPAQDSFCQYVVGTNTPLLVRDAREDPLTSSNASIETMGVVAWAGYPVHAPSGEVLGTFCVVDTVPHVWTDHDAEVLATLAQAASSEIALRSALAGEHAARTQAEEAVLRAEVAAAQAADTAQANAELADAVRASRDALAALARTLGESLLPPHLPDVPGVDVAASHLPAATGGDLLGDFYDLFEAARGTWCVLLGDVCGKGSEAAQLTAMARYTLRAAAARTVRPRKVLSELNAAMLRQRPGAERFLTVAYASIRRTRNGVALTMCTAGHPSPLIRRADGHVRLACPPGMPLGLFERPALKEVTVDLAAGDAVVFYSDGVTEARSGREELGEDALRTIVAGGPGACAQALVDHVQAEVTSFRDGPPHDDTAVLVVLVPR